MGSKRVINTEVAIKEAKSIHGDKYNYDLVDYIDYETPLVIVCHEHGIFKQKYQKHCKLGRGCWECGKKSCVKNRFKKSTSEYVKQANAVHNNKYDYTKTIYTLNSNKVIISCPIHGDFEQVANSHLMGSGCSACAKIHVGLSARIGKEVILERFKTKHGNFYTYDIDDNVKTDDSIEIICPSHGLFIQKVGSHFLHGCSKCGDESLSLKMRKIPKELERLSRNTKRSIKSFIKKQGYSKKVKTYNILGCSWEELQEHLEDNPYGFTIFCEDINIDHIVPLATIKQESDIYLLNYYTNLQLLPKDYNQHIKKDKPFNREHFENWMESTNYNKC